MITRLVTFNVKMTVDSEQIIELFKLYKYSQDDVGLTKKGFIDYIRSQLIQFGTGTESLIGNMDHYKDLSDNDMIMLEKWKLI